MLHTLALVFASAEGEESSKTLFYVAGGLSSNQILAPSISNVSLLPGYNRNSSPTNVDWLSETPKSVTIAPGRSTTVTVTVNAGAPGIVTFGDYTAALSLSADTPYPVRSIPVTMHVGPAGDWGRIAGTVLGPDGHGHHVPLAGATVKIRSGAKGQGLNVDTGEYEDLVKAGIIDPTMVTRSALQNAASIAKNILTTEAVVAEVPEKNPVGAGMPGGMPDMM